MGWGMKRSCVSFDTWLQPDWSCRHAPVNRNARRMIVWQWMFFSTWWMSVSVKKKLPGTLSDDILEGAGRELLHEAGQGQADHLVQLLPLVLPAGEGRGWEVGGYGMALVRKILHRNLGCWWSVCDDQVYEGQCGEEPGSDLHYQTRIVSSVSLIFIFLFQIFGKIFFILKLFLWWFSGAFIYLKLVFWWDSLLNIFIGKFSHNFHRFFPRFSVYYQGVS